METHKLEKIDLITEIKTNTINALDIILNIVKTLL